MKKWMTKKNAFVLVALFFYCLFVWCCSVSIRDAEIEVTTLEDTGNGSMIQLFWDDGAGYNAENAVYAEIVSASGSMSIAKEAAEGIVSYRWDPVNVQQDITYTSIRINGKEIPPEVFASWVIAADQVEMEVIDEGGAKQLSFCVGSNDAKLYLNDEFTETVCQATKMTTDMRWIATLLGAFIAVGAIFFEEIVFGISWCLNRIEALLQSIFEGHDKWKTFIAIAVLGIVAFLVMNQYLLGNQFFIFKDASDSYYQTYPQLINDARYIKEGLTYGSYNFRQGLGAGQGYIKFNLANWVAYFGEENVAYLMGVSQMLKIFLSGLLFYGVMRVRGKEQWYSIVLALGYAFCGHMVIRSSWSNYPNEVVLLAFWLFCFELWFQKKDFRWLPLATFVFFYHYSTGYYQVIYIAILVIYVVFRYITERKVNVKACLLVGGIAGVGTLCYLFLTDFSLVHMVLGALSSDRAQATMSNTDWNLESFLLDFSLLPRIFGRTVGLSSLGIIGKDYVNEYWNSLEDPTFYCGLMVLLLIPLAFSMMNMKKKVWYGIAYAGAIVYCFSEPLRTILNGFSGVTYKLSSFWIIIVMLFTVAQIDWNEIHTQKKERRSFIICTITAITLIWAMYKLPTVIGVVQENLNISIYFVILEYIAVSLLLLKKDLKYSIKIILVLLVCSEVAILAYPVYNDRVTADGSEYADDTVEAVAKIKEIEGDSFYRIDKQYESAQICDSLAQDYYGTAFYIGGTGPSSAIAAFYNDLGLPIFSKNRMAWGTSSYDEVQAVLGIKYALTKDESVANYGYTKIGEAGNVNIYENKNAMPMGFVYHYAVERSTFETLDNKQRQQVLLRACLVEDGNSSLPLISSEKLEELEITDTLFEKYEIPFESAENYSFVFEPTTEDEMLAVKIVFDKTGRGNLCYLTEDGTSNSMLILQEDSDTGQIFGIDESNVSRIWSDSPNWAEIISLRIAKIPKEEYYAIYEQDLDNLKKSAVEIIKYEDDYIKGSFHTETDGVLYLPVPNDGGWQVYIDGELQEKMTINDAFIGIPVSAGEHTVTLLCGTGTFGIVYGKDIKLLVGCVILIILGSIWLHTKKKRGLANERNINSSTSI